MTKIKSISFLINGERVTIDSNQSGKFPLPVSKITNGKIRTAKMDHTAMAVVEHKLVRVADPFITLQNGEKLRVYQGGDCSYMLTTVASIIDSHDTAAKPKSLRSEKSTLNPGQFEFPWEDFGDWD